ncbi:MAG: hypothetical protein JWQ75_698 [Pseudarthrobacter sp.]|nr:hypothetical protein [Pseudarthrobacter sp.]
MPNDVTINISVGSSPGGQSGSDGSAGDAPSPASFGALGAPGNATARGDAPPSGDAPAPLPLDQLRAGSSHEDPTEPVPSPRESPSAEDGGDAPAPLPLDELRPDGGG